MASISLLSKIIRGTWLIDKEASEGYLVAALQLISGVKVENFEGNEEKNSLLRQPFASFASSSEEVFSNYKTYDEAPQGSIAIIPIDGVLEKNDYCGIPGTATLAQRVQDADNHPNISAIILKTDSPGGHVDGTETFANVVKSTKKPVVAFVDGLAASAAYWIISGADTIILSGETTKVGSVGTMASIRDLTKYYEEMGIRIFDIYATKSIDKNRDIRDLIEKNDSSTLKKERLDPLNEVFLNHVSSVRKDHIDPSKENVLSGKIYIGKRSIEVGLADEIGDFRSAINKARDLAGETTKIPKSKEKVSLIESIKAHLDGLFSKSQSNHNSNKEMNFKRSLEILGKENPSAEELAEIKKEIEQFTGANEKFTKEELDQRVADAEKAKQTELDQANTKVQEKEKELRTAQEKIEALEKEKEQLEDASDSPEKPASKGQEQLETTKTDEESYSVQQANKELGDLD